MSTQRISLIALVCAILMILFNSCRIDPPLRLTGRDDVEMRFGMVQVDFNLIWELDTDWESDWWYGWNDDDVNLWGELGYPEPQAYEVRIHYLGRVSPDDDYLSVTPYYTTEKRIRRKMDYGFHNMLVWSDVFVSDGVQSLVVDESEPTNVYATTSKTFMGISRTGETTMNAPEPFFAGWESGIEITDNPDDYDSFLADEQVWIKQIKAYMQPRVYIYLVQVVIYNNNGRITGTGGAGSVSGLAMAVQLHTGRTSYNESTVAFDMRMKRNIPARNGRYADIIGGRLTTFGLCDMSGWGVSRSARYTGSRADLPNRLRLPIRFINDTDSVFDYDISDQLQRQAHGGVVTIEIDADTITIPSRHGGVGGGFDPTLEDTDEEENIFTM